MVARGMFFPLFSNFGNLGRSYVFRWYHQPSPLLVWTAWGPTDRVEPRLAEIADLRREVDALRRRLEGPPPPRPFLPPLLLMRTTSSPPQHEHNRKCGLEDISGAVWNGTAAFERVVLQFPPCRTGCKETQDQRAFRGW